METVIELKGYSKDFQKQNNSGWGCGYVIVPKNHPIRVKKMIAGDDPYFYPQFKDFDNEITFYEEDDKHITIGFDTAHMWNDASHDKKWVQQKAIKLKNCVDSYTMDRAKIEVSNHINTIKAKFIDFLY